MPKKSSGGLAILAFILSSFEASAETRDSWLEIRSPHFIVVTNAGENRARRVAFEFEQIRGAIQQFFPKARLEDGKEIVILAVKDEKSLKELMPQYWERKGLKRPAGQFVSAPGKHLVALRIDAPSEYAYHTIYHEYAHQMLAINFYPLPLWLNEGLAEFFANTSIQGDVIKLGFPDSGHLYLLQERRPLPLRELFAVDYDSPHYNEAERASIFYAQSWAVTHYFMVANQAAGQKQIAEYLRLVDEDIPETEALERAFGDPVALEKTLNVYIQRQSFGFFRGKTQETLDSKTFTRRELTPAESLARRGDYLVAENRPVEARALLNEALALDPALAAAYESLGLLSLFQGDVKEAARLFQKSVGLGSKSALAHFYDATLSAEGSLSDESSERLEEGLRRAIELNPSDPQAMSVLATVYASRHERLDEALELARKADQLQPGVLAWQLNLARVLLAMGRIAEARNIGERALARAKTDIAREAVRSFLEAARLVSGK